MQPCKHETSDSAFPLSLARGRLRQSMYNRQGYVISAAEPAVLHWLSDLCFTTTDSTVNSGQTLETSACRQTTYAVYSVQTLRKSTRVYCSIWRTTRSIVRTSRHKAKPKRTQDLLVQHATHTAPSRLREANSQQGRGRPVTSSHLPAYCIVRQMTLWGVTPLPAFPALSYNLNSFKHSCCEWVLQVI